ncbi:TOMM precursor leader peptide-binding protein [Bradyrhizobium manausense]|uniref:TOMM precursor leader peptide-binding protein n=1 Tax=Bradyrhizobium TaxID=374 RepID=UPI001BABE2FA|nr:MULTISPECIES: TOMM precursor leader peptide-binding protein [Bradyrhizobium]MBR0829700.1 TOMM precursor leader peptide-binding protein [Bradyrhizobium manausense]UVO25317.1 TOMM precursor leader peptide-binding protein [Bradyrhizobium arachidis]
MTGNRKTRVVRQIRKDFLRFAPNFTAYALPPGAVCLYSEDRKFFLHGELYCALATAIGQQGKARPEIVRQLSKRFPADKIEEAITRLLDRRYVVAQTPQAFDEAVGGFWASLGLSLEVAEQNLRDCSVRVESIDVKGAKELTAALSKLGVQIAKRSPKLTITLANDYLDRRLAELNEERVTGKSRWLLVQPSGAFPLVGPVFKPGESACWTCLFDRMIRNREIKGFLDRGPARAVALSPLVRESVGRTGIHFAAVEIAKAIASGFRTDLRDHIASFDLTGATIAKHYVARRPQCPTCGSKKLSNPRRSPALVEIAEGKRLVMTSGGYRTVTSRATVSRFRKHVSPLTGVVTRLERIDADLPMNTNYFAQHNFSAPARSIDQLRSGLSGGSFGKGSTAEQGEASALMESIERYSGIFQGDEIRMMRRFADFAPGEALLPNDVQLFSETQFKTRFLQEPDDSHPVPEPFDPSTKTEWSPVTSLRDKCFRYLPTGLLYFFYGGFHTDSNGCAAGNTRDEAIVQGFLELVERDAYAIWWYNRVQRAEVDLEQFDDFYVQDLQAQFAEAGRKLWVLDITSDLGIPTYVAIMHWMQNGHENIEFGSGAHFDRRIALLRALTELTQFMSVGMMGGQSGEKPTLDGVTPLRLEDYPFLTPSDRPIVPPAPSLELHDNTRDQVIACVEIAARAGYDFLVLDQTRPDVEVPVVRVVVPGLRHFYRRFAPGRLYDVPLKLGLLERPRLESELTTFLPHT